MSREKIFHLRALGAQVVLTRSDVNKGHPAYYQDYARRLANELPARFISTSSITRPIRWRTVPLPHRNCLNSLTARSMPSSSAWGPAVRWGLTGVVCRTFAADGICACRSGRVGAGGPVETGRHHDAGSWLVEGIGEDFIPPLAHIEGVNRARRITDREAFTTARDLLKRKGSGRLLHRHAAGGGAEILPAQTTPKRVVTFACDSGNKYLSKMFNDDWMRQQGLISRPQAGDLSDYIALRHDEGATVTAARTTRFPPYWPACACTTSPSCRCSITTRSSASSMSGTCCDTSGRCRSLLTPVTAAMTRQVEYLDKQAPESALYAIFDRGPVAIIYDENRFLGLITQ